MNFTARSLNIFLVIALISLFLHPSCKKKEPGRYYSTEKGFSVKFPENWEIVEGHMGSTVLAKVPQDGSVLDFRNNVNVIAENLSRDTSLDQYIELQVSSMRQAKNLILNYRIIEDGKMEIDRCPSRWFVASYGIVTLRIRAVSCTMIRKHRGYVITGVFEEMKFNKYRKIFDEIVASFRFEQ